jgi:hypothetical protein
MCSVTRHSFTRRRIDTRSAVRVRGLLREAPRSRPAIDGLDMAPPCKGVVFSRAYDTTN